MSGSGISWAKCKSAPHQDRLHASIIPPLSFFTGWMPFLPPTNSVVVSTSLSISIASGALMLQTCRIAHLSVYLCVCVCVRKVYWDKTADWIRMPSWVVRGVGRGMGVLDGGGDRRREGQFWGEFGASHCN